MAKASSSHATTSRIWTAVARASSMARTPSRARFPKPRNCHCCARSAFPARVRAWSIAAGSMQSRRGARLSCHHQAEHRRSRRGNCSREFSGELERAIASSQIDLGIDSTALLQEFIPARGGHISRVETLGGKFLYAMRSTRQPITLISVRPRFARRNALRVKVMDPEPALRSSRSFRHARSSRMSNRSCPPPRSMSAALNI